MQGAPDRRLTFVWLVLAAITFAQLGVGMGEAGAVVAPNVAITAGAIALALLKVRIIVREFMEVRHAPPLLAHLTDVWVLVTAVALAGGHVAGTLLRVS